MAVLTVGAGLEYSTISAAVAGAHSGDTIKVQAGTYTNDFPGLIDGLTIEGVGGTVHLVATTAPPNGKAIFDVTGNTTLDDLDFSGATNDFGNGAGVRYEGGTLDIENSTFENNQEGLLGLSDPTGSITIHQSEFFHNGTGSLQSPEIDVGDIATFTMTNSYVHDPVGGSEVKSRAESSVIFESRLYDNGVSGSYLVDLPNGGNLSITESYLLLSGNEPTGIMIVYGEEGSPHAGTAVTMESNELVSDRASSNVFSNAGGAVINSTSSVYWNLPDGWQFGSDTIWRPDDQWYGSPVNGGDTDPPTVTASESVSGWTNSTSETLSGTANDSGSGLAGVEVFDNSGAIDLGAAAMDAYGNWSFTATGLVNGSHTFVVQVTDNAGNVARISTGPADNVDTVAPTLTAGGSVSGTTASRGIVLSGTVADSGSGVGTVEVLDQTGGKWVDLGQATVTGRTWTFTEGDLAVGSHSFIALATDNVGNMVVASAGAPLAVVAAMTLQPTLQRIIGNTDGGVTLLGTAAAGSTVTIADTTGGVTRTLGSAVVGADGAFSLTSHSKASTAAVNTYAVSASDAAGHQGTGSGLFQLSSAGSDAMSGTTGQSDVFATFLRTGQDTIAGFETTKAVGAAHDVVNLSGTGYASYAQVAPHISGTSSAVIQLDATRSVTLLGVSAASLGASDFRFS